MLLHTVRQRFVLGAGVLVLALALTSTGLRWATGAFDQHLELVATFDRTGHGLDTFSDVRVRGVAVGRVGAIELDDDQRARVTLRLAPGTRVPPDTTASIEATSIFGPKFLALDVDPEAVAGPVLEDGDAIARTRTATELSEMLTRVDALLQAADPEVVGALTASMARVGRDLAPRVGPMLEDADTLTGVAADHLDDGAALLDHLQRFTAEARGWGTQLGGIATDAGPVLSLLPDREQDLAHLLDEGTAAGHEVAHLLETHPTAFSDLADGLLPALVPPLAAVAGNLDVVPTFVEVIAVFFGELASIMHLDGPDGQRLGAIELGVSPDPCEVFEVLQCHEGAR